MNQVVLQNSILCSDLSEAKSFCAASAYSTENRIINNVSNKTTVSRQYERKMFTTVLLISLCIAIPPLLFVAAYMYFSAEEELGVSVSQYEKERKKRTSEVRQAPSLK